MAETFQDIICPSCQQHLDVPTNAVVQRDTVTGGLKGRHIKCPEPPKPSQVFVQMTGEHLALILTTARILRATVSEQGLHYRDEDMAALSEALAPFGPNPGPGENTGEPTKESP